MGPEDDLDRLHLFLTLRLSILENVFPHNYIEINYTLTDISGIKTTRITAIIVYSIGNTWTN